MTLRINYLGSADRRVIERLDLMGRGLTDPGADLVWSRANSYEQVVPNDVGAFLLAQGEFATDDNLDYGDALADAIGGRLLGVAIVEYNVTTTASGASPIVIPGMQVEIEAAGRPLKVELSALFNNATAAQGCQVFLREDGVNIQMGFPIQQAAGIGEMLTTQVSRQPAAGLHIYSVHLGRFTSGTAGVVGAETIPATLMVTEL